MSLLTRSDLLGATSPPQELVSLAALGGEILVRGMTGRERDAFEASCFEGKGKKRDFNLKDVRAKLVSYCCIDANGHRLFTDGDVEALSLVRADLIDKLFAVAQKLSGMREEDLEELGKPSASPIASGSLSSDSHAN